MEYPMTFRLYASLLPRRRFLDFPRARSSDFPKSRIIVTRLLETNHAGTARRARAMILSSIYISAFQN